MKIEDIDYEINKYQYLKQCLLKYQHIKEEDSINTKTYKMYLTIESVTKITDILNNDGYRILSVKGSRKYRVTDVSEILCDSEADVEYELKDVVQKLFKGNKKGSKYERFDKKWLKYHQ